MTPEESAAGVVGLDPSGHHVTLTAPGLAPVRLSGHANTALAAAERDAVRAVVAAVLRAAGAANNARTGEPTWPAPPAG